MQPTCSLCSVHNLKTTGILTEILRGVNQVPIIAGQRNRRKKGRKLSSGSAGHAYVQAERRASDSGSMVASMNLWALEIQTCEGDTGMPCSRTSTQERLHNPSPDPERLHNPSTDPERLHNPSTDTQNRNTLSATLKPPPLPVSSLTLPHFRPCFPPSSSTLDTNANKALGEAAMLSLRHSSHRQDPKVYCQNSLLCKLRSPQ